MSTKQFNPGDQVYDIHGRAGSYIASANGGHLVEPIYEDDEFEPHYASVETWREVFGTPPKQRLTADIAELDAQLTAKHEQLTNLQRSIQDTELEAKALRQRIKENAQLGDIDMWLQGKVTHIVSLHAYSVDIGTVEEVLRRTDRERELRLLALKVDPKAQRYWTSYATYSDGSGSQTPCILATSIEDAREKAAAYVVKQTRETPAHMHDGLAASAIRCGVPISDELRRAAEAMEQKHAIQQLERARESRDRATREVTEAEARVQALGVTQ